MSTSTITQFTVPTRDQVSSENQAIFDDLKGKLGIVPNLFATFALSNTALGKVLTFSNGKTSLSNKEKEVINLSVSQENNCLYCLAAHTAISKMNGFTDEQIIEIRRNEVSFDQRFAALANLAHHLVAGKGRVEPQVLDRFFDAGYTQENLVDAIVAVADKTFANYVHNVTQVPVDFPAAPSLN